MWHLAVLDMNWKGNGLGASADRNGKRVSVKELTNILSQSRSDFQSIIDVFSADC
jgi:hypothetical protein